MAAYWLTGSNGERDIVGGKGYHLMCLRRWGANVPSFGVVTTAAFHHWLDHKVLPPGLVDQIAKGVTSWGVDRLAVRSSMTAEDSGEASYAGVMETFLYVRPEHVEEMIIECFKSAFSDRAVDYHNRQSHGAKKLSAAVVVQSMIPSETSGVAFSRAPVGNSALVYIEAGRGLGEGVVAGKVEVDAFWWDRFGSEVRRKIAKKNSQMHFDPNLEKVTMGTVSALDSTRPCLEHEFLNLLSKEVIRLEDHLGAGADVEWAVALNKLWILQVRPITQKLPPLGIYVDTNLSESYPGLTSPLTADFVKQMYTKVFKEAMDILYFSNARKKAFNPYIETLIEEFSGHLYYRLNSYYVAISGLPGGKKNLEAWHRMIGGRIQGVHFPEVSPPGLFQNLAMTVGLLKLVFFHKGIYREFIERTDKEARENESLLDNSKSAKDVAALVTRVARDVKGWGLTALNDVLVMTGLKALTKIFEGAGFKEENVVELLKTHDGVESMGPLLALEKICADIERKSDFSNCLREVLAQLRSNESFDIWAELRRSGYSREAEKIQAFLAEFGDRAFEELKLECLTFKQAPETLIRLLLWFLDSAGVSRQSRPIHSRPAEIGQLKFWIRPFAIWLLGFTRQAIQARESTRLMRGRWFGWIRRGVLKLHERLQDEAPDLFRDFSKKDAFALSFSEMESFGQGAMSIQELHKRFLAKRNWHEQKVEYPELFAHPLGSDVTPYFLEGDSQSQPVTDGQLQGTGAAPGRAKGRALVLTDPREALGVENPGECILVTRSTDPAWVFIMSRCAGLLSEKGSLLSHTAIIGRELGIPTVVGASGAVNVLKTGEQIEIDGSTGEVKRL